MIGTIETTGAIINDKTYFEMEQGFFKIPNFIYELSYEMGLTRVERDIYLCLIRFQNGSNRNPFPSYKTLKKYTMITRNDTISSGIKGLEEKGLIEVISRGTTQGKSNVYKVNYIYPEVIESPSEDVEIKTSPIKKKQNKSQQKAYSKQYIPVRRGKHDDITTSKEMEERLAYYQSEKYKEEERLMEDALERLLAL